MGTKRQRWRLPEKFKAAKVKKGSQQRYDGEPRFYELGKFANDKTLTTHFTNKCCDCGLEHHNTFNILKVKKKWYMIERAYRIPGTGRKDK